MFCASDVGHVLDDVMCEKEAKPQTEKQCEGKSSCDDGHWFVGPWSEVNDDTEHMYSKHLSV